MSETKFFIFIFYKPSLGWTARDICSKAANRTNFKIVENEKFLAILVSCFGSYKTAEDEMLAKELSFLY